MSLPGCAETEISNPPVQVNKQLETNKNQTPEQIAKEFVQLLKDKNMQTLAEYIHPTKGIRFTPYSYINLETDCVLPNDQIKNAFDDKTAYGWGHFDGSGEPINMTFEEYFKEYTRLKIGKYGGGLWGRQ